MENSGICSSSWKINVILEKSSNLKKHKEAAMSVSTFLIILKTKNKKLHETMAEALKKESLTKALQFDKNVIFVTSKMMTFEITDFLKKLIPKESDGEFILFNVTYAPTGNFVYHDSYEWFEKNVGLEEPDPYRE